MSTFFPAPKSNPEPVVPPEVKTPLFLTGGDRVCYGTQFYTVLGCFASLYNNKVAVIHSLRDKHFHIYDIMGDDGNQLYNIPREQLRFLERKVSDDRLLYSCWGSMRKFQRFPVTHPEDELDDNTKEIPDGTNCLWVSREDQCVVNCITLSHTITEGVRVSINGEMDEIWMIQHYEIELENGIAVHNIIRGELYPNEYAFYYDAQKEGTIPPLNTIPEVV